ncbi:hypothetical protein [Streptomyces canus]|uniref:oxidoreductase n=1 Tax=Streptomyces canus TaxID=58343 RepID=UPI000996C87E|nr:hypothetical protein [Streptomyces canus]
MTESAAGMPLRIGPHTMRNRIFISAHTLNFAEHHRVSDRHLEYHRRRAAGGVGLIVTEGLRIHPTSLKRPETLSLWTNDAVPGLARLAEVVHDEGALLFGQILHSGREAADAYPRTPSWGPSPIPWARGAALPHVMTDEDIAELVDCFAQGARRVVEAGLDGLEVHLGHGHLLQQFLSPLSNARLDSYGGSLEGRRRVVDEVLAAVRAMVPGSVAMGVRVSGDEFMDGGLTVEHMAPMCASLVEDHDLDFVNVSHSAYVGGPSLSTQMADMAHSPTPFRSIPRAVKQALGSSVPVLAAGRVDTLEDADRLIAAGDADAVAMTRAHIADPTIVVGRRAGATQRRCVSCNQLCIGRSSEGLALSCVVNPEVGLEEAWSRIYSSLEAAVSSRPRILVVGAGPAGLEAGAVAARWADVTVVDGRTEPGGNIALASRVGTRRSKWAQMVEDQVAACEEREVTLKLDTYVDPSALNGDAWDSIVYATGAPYHDRPVPTQRAPYRSIVADVTADLGPAGRFIVFDDVGGWPAWSWVEHLLDRGHEVHYVTPLSSLAPQITVYSRLGLVSRVRATGRLSVHLMKEVESWDGSRVRLSAAFGESVEVPDVTAVYDLGVPVSPHTDGWPRGVVVGDAYAPRDAGWAVFSGRRGGLEALVRSGAVKDPATCADLLHRLTTLPLLGL